MDQLEEGYLFWKRFDAHRDPNKTLKEFAIESGLNYELIKVQRSLNRIPKAYEVSLIAQKVGVPVELLLQDFSQFPPVKQKQILIYCALNKVKEETVDEVASLLKVQEEDIRISC
jgi:hypothetical protein